MLRGVLLVAAALLLILANVGTWLRGTILDSNEFTSTVDGVLRQPEATARISDLLATQALSSGELRARIEGLVPGDSKLITVLLDAELHGAVARVLDGILNLSALQDLVKEAIRSLHSTLVSFLEDRRETLALQDGRLVLNLRSVLDELFGRLDLAVPERLNNETAGEVVLVEDAGALDTASTFVRAVDALVPVLFLLALAAGAAAIFRGRNRARGVVLCGYAIVAAGLVSLLVWRLSGAAFETVLAERPLALNLLEALTTNLKWQSIGLVALGAVVALAADARFTHPVSVFAGRMWRQVDSAGTGWAFLAAAATLVLLLLVV